MKLTYLDYLDLSSVPPIIRFFNYKYIKLIGKAQMGERLDVSEWKKVIKSCNAALFDQIAIYACALRDKKEAAAECSGEFELNFHGLGIDDLALMMADIQEKQYSKINIDADILAEKTEDAFRNRERSERFLYILALIRCASHSSEISVRLAEGTDELTKEKILNAGADFASLP